MRIFEGSEDSDFPTDLLTVSTSFVRLPHPLSLPTSFALFCSILLYVDDFRIFCGDLGNETTDDMLVKAFSKYPSFQKAKVIKDKKTQKCKGYGFVSFKDPDDYMKAMKEMNGEIRERGERISRQPAVSSFQSPANKNPFSTSPLVQGNT